MKELKEIKKEIKYIKEHMVDVDFFLSHEEEKILEKSMKEFEEGKAVKLEDFERKWGFQFILALLHKNFWVNWTKSIMKG